MSDLLIVPVEFRDACDFVDAWHRHHDSPIGHKFSLGVALGTVLVGVAIVGRPGPRHLQDGFTLEVTRTATDGTPNANSALYGAAWRAAKSIGYRRLITYNSTAIAGPVCGTPCDHPSCHTIRRSESGVSLRAAGYRIVAQRPPRAGWDAPSRPRKTLGTEWVARTLWEAS